MGNQENISNHGYLYSRQFCHGHYLLINHMVSLKKFIKEKRILKKCQKYQFFIQSFNINMGLVLHLIWIDKNFKINIGLGCLKKWFKRLVMGRVLSKILNFKKSQKKQKFEYRYPFPHGTWYTSKTNKTRSITKKDWLGLPFLP